MKKQFLFIMIFCITGIAFQIHPMDAEKLGLTKKETNINPILLIPINSYLQSRDTIESTTKYQNNYVTPPPTITTQNNVSYSSTISSTHQSHSIIKEKEINENELYEAIPLHDIKDDNIEKELSLKCGGIDCGKIRRDHLCLGVSFITSVAGILSFFMYVLVRQT